MVTVTDYLHERRVLQTEEIPSATMGDIELVPDPKISVEFEQTEELLSVFITPKEDIPKLLVKVRLQIDGREIFLRAFESEDFRTGESKLLLELSLNVPLFQDIPSKWFILSLEMIDPRGTTHSVDEPVLLGNDPELRENPIAKASDPAAIRSAGSSFSITESGMMETEEGRMRRLAFALLLFAVCSAQSELPPAPGEFKAAFYPDGDFQTENGIKMISGTSEFFFTPSREFRDVILEVTVGLTKARRFVTEEYFSFLQEGEQISFLAPDETADNGKIPSYLTYYLRVIRLDGEPCEWMAEIPKTARVLKVE